MRFTQPEISVHNPVRAEYDVNDRKFKQIAIEESESVWSKHGLATINALVEEFEAEYGEMDASGVYQLVLDGDEPIVVANVAGQYPLDPVLGEEGEVGNVSDFDSLNEQLIDAQKAVAERISARIGEFVSDQ